MTISETRTPYDGQPFYCNTCGLGWAEFIACEDVDCKLESQEQAQIRAAKRRKLTSDSPFFKPKDG